MLDCHAHINHWIFDLDDTLYPKSTGLFKEINARMTQYVMSYLGFDYEAAQKLRVEYYHEYGTTVAGLLQNYKIDPDAFLKMALDIDLSALKPNPELGRQIHALPGRKIIYTNGTADHARKVLSQLEIEGAFDAIFGVEDANYQSKPLGEAYKIIFDMAGIPAETSAFFEDRAENLVIPYQMGLSTFLIDEGHHISTPPEYIMRRARDVDTHLAEILACDHQ